MKFPAISRRRFIAHSIAGMATAAATQACSPKLMQALPAKQSLYIDGLSFLPDNMTDVGRSGISAMICDVSKVEEVRDADGTPRYQRNFAVNDAALDAAIKRIDASPQIFLAKKGADIGSKPGCAAFLQFQSCETIGRDLSRISYFHGKGLRVLQLTHHNNNLFGGGAIEPEHSGLTNLGREGIPEMNRIGILPDISHGSDQTMLEAIHASQSAVVYSHGACRALVNHPRCISDAAIKAIADKGGVIGIFMMSFWLTSDPKPNITHLIAHIRHVINIGGIDSVAISNDFPMSGQQNLRKLNNDNAEGVKQYLGWWRAMRKLGVSGYEEDPQHVVIPELNNINRMAIIDRALAADGFSDSERTKIMGANWARVLSDVLR